ncbi:MAG: DUF4230 domain-containing protein [Johnsonella sp.]|nr:DUF4230 domain-containing protein [Johnsonella sp.]
MKKIISFLPFAVGMILAVMMIKAKPISPFEKGEETIITSSTLKEAIDIAELSTSQFTYNGIAKLYQDEKKGRVKCHIRYNATVKAGIDMHAVRFEINDVSRTIRPILPEIRITSNTVDEKSLSFIPNNTKLELKDALVLCREDALAEAKESKELLISAEENLRSVIEALLLPLIAAQGYTIIWS